MKALSLVLLAFSLLFFHPECQADKPLTYYLPEGEYDPAIMAPEAFFGFQIGEWHLDHGQLLAYIQYLAEKSDRAIVYEYARSHEQRPLVHLVITSPENQKNLEAIRQSHLLVSDPQASGDLDIADMSVVVRLGYGVHGNEASGHNAAPLVAYYLRAF